MNWIEKYSKTRKFGLRSQFVTSKDCFKEKPNVFEVPNWHLKKNAVNV